MEDRIVILACAILISVIIFIAFVSLMITWLGVTDQLIDIIRYEVKDAYASTEVHNRKIEQRLARIEGFIELHLAAPYKESYEQDRLGK